MSTHPLMLSCTSPGEALLACHSFPPWNLPSFTMQSTLYFSCSHSDLTRQGASLSHLMIWCSGQTALFLLLQAKVALAYLPTALSVALRPIFPFQQVQYVQLFLLKPAPCCTLFAGLGSINNSAISLLLSSYLTLVLSSPPCPPSFLLPQTLWQIWKKLSSLSSCSVRLQWVSRHSFLLGNDVADELARRECYLHPPQSLVVSFLLSLVSTYLELEAYCLIEIL